MTTSIAGRFGATQGTILVLQDTTMCSYQRERPEFIVGKTSIRSGKRRLLRPLTQCGILIHSSLVLTSEGLPLGLVAGPFWTRDSFKGTRALKRRTHPIRVPIEEKESHIWLENMRQSTAVRGAPVRCRKALRVSDRFLVWSRRLNVDPIERPNDAS